MKIFYTKHFKENINEYGKSLGLGKFKLRFGKDTGLGEKITTVGISEVPFLGPTSPSSINNDTYYYAEVVRYNGGLQLSLDIDSIDASLYEKENNKSFYQVIIFYYEDLSIGEEPKPAFIVFEDFKDGIFSNLNITSSRVIVTTPPLNIKSQLVLNQSELTKALENEWGNSKTTITASRFDNIENKDDDISLISVNSIEKFWADQISSFDENTNSEWLETTHLNNFGLKIY